MRTFFSHHFGIWERLLLAFGAIAGVTVLAVMTALFLLDSSSDIFATITEKNLPELAQVSEISELSGRIVAIAPSLASAPDGETKRQIREDLDKLLDQFSHKASLFQNISPQRKDAMNAELAALKENLLSLQRVVAERLELETELVKHMERLRWLYADLLGELDPLGQDLNYNLDAEIERIINAAGNAHSSSPNGRNGQDEMQTAASRLRMNRQFKKLVDNIANDGDMLVSLLLQSSSVQREAEIDNLAALSRDTIDSLNISLQHLSGEASILTLRQVLSDIFSRAEGDSSVFAIKNRILERQRAGQQILIENRNIVERLQATVGAVVSRTQQEALQAAAITKLKLDSATWSQLLLVMVSLVIAACVMWFYVRGNIVARLDALAVSMKAIASGDLNHPVPEAGLDEIGQMTAALRVFRDTAREVEEANAQAIIDNAAAGLIIAEANGDIRFVNPMVASLFGLNPMPMAGEVLFSFVSIEEREALATACREAFDGDGQQPVIKLCQGLRSDGSTFPVEILIRPVQQRTDRKLLITLYDVTEREEAQELLRQRVRQKTEHLSRINEKLREEVKERRRVQDELVQAGKLAALGQLSAGIAHELNQPLSAIRYYLHNARLLLQRGKLDLHQENIDKMGELSERMAKLINHLKNFARLPSNKLLPVDAAPVIDRALYLFESRIAEEGITFERNYKDVSSENTPCKVLAEDIRLEQVLVNIVGNAIDAVSEQPEDQRTITVDMVDTGNAITIEITDSGPGIPPEVKDSIFDPFYTTKEVGKGLGLGLSISYNIVKDMQGEIIASSDADGGTRFSLSFQKADG